MDVGARLKEARKAKGLSLESLQEKTKIQKRYLIAIEEGNLHLLPGKFYARAFIKEYATAVGLDPNELLEEHKEEIPSSEGENPVQYTRVERSRREKSLERSSAFFSVLPKIIVVLLIVGIIGAAIWFYSQASSPNDPTEIEEPDGNVIITNPDGVGSTADVNDSTEDEEETTDEPESEQEEEEPEEVAFNVEEVIEGSPAQSTITITNPTDELIVTFSSEIDVWLDVENGAGTAFYNGFVTADNSPLEIDLSGEETIFLNVGSAPNLEIMINGVPFDYPVDPSEMDHQRLWFNVE